MTSIRRIWGCVRNDQKGTILVEKNVLLIVAVVGVFGVASLLLPWFQEYLNDTSDALLNAGKPNSFRSVTWK
ncbi:hypothetical protein QO009_003057 [Brevibacillus aydinogluensis]|nr:hypothetical protein [Brevibacillus aydinogluensis]